MIVATSLDVQYLALAAEEVGPADAPHVSPSTGPIVFSWPSARLSDPCRAIRARSYALPSYRFHGRKPY